MESVATIIRMLLHEHVQEKPASIEISLGEYTRKSLKMLRKERGGKKYSSN